MDEDQVGLRGKLDCQLQFLPGNDGDDNNNDDNDGVMVAPFSPNSETAPVAQGGELTMSVVKAKELLNTNFMGEPDPFVRVRLSRGGYLSPEFNQETKENKENKESKESKENKENKEDYSDEFGSSIPVRQAVSLSSGGKGLGGTGGGVSSYTTRVIEDGGRYVNDDEEDAGGCRRMQHRLMLLGM
jgi:hypothetical protein